MAQVISVVRQASSWSIAWGVILVLLGILAIGAPLIAAVAVSILVGWLLIFAGVVHIIVGFHSHAAGSILWKLLVGLAYLLVGGYMLLHPVLGVASLTLALAALFILEGALNFALYFSARSLRGSAWFLIDAFVTLLVGVMIYLQWPSSSLWAIGVLVGVSLMISGFSRVGIALAVRRATAPPSQTRLAA